MGLRYLSTNVCGFGCQIVTEIASRRRLRLSYSYLHQGNATLSSQYCVSPCFSTYYYNLVFKAITAVFDWLADWRSETEEAPILLPIADFKQLIRIVTEASLVHQKMATFHVGQMACGSPRRCGDANSTRIGIRRRRSFKKALAVSNQSSITLHSDGSRLI